MSNTVYKIRGAVQAYDWGGYSFIPAILGDSAPREKPSAEYWLGVHPRGLAQVQQESGENISLTELQERIGDKPLPFLMKLLDVRQMLSIQVHPSKEQAETGFAREERLEIPLSAGNRTYKDRNHKPELMCALSEFWMLHGLRTEADIKETLEQRSLFRPLLPILEKGGLPGLVESILDREGPANAVAESLLKEISSQPDVGKKSCHEFWIHRWAQSNPEDDRGLLMILLMNLVQLQPGEAIYQPDRLIHAYLEGRNVEIMANSDNVLRAGLTRKHMDVDDLLQVATVTSTSPMDYKVVAGRDQNGIRSFNTPFDDFHLSDIEVLPDSRKSLPAIRSQILFCLSGEGIEIEAGGKALKLLPGESCFAPKESQLTLCNDSYTTAHLFIAS